MDETRAVRESTHALGSFVGVRVDGRLVAMAGERVRFDRSVEIGGVCVAPGHPGAGPAARLTTEVARRNAARERIALLPVFESDSGAVALYERLGFRTRAVLHLSRATPA